MKLQGEFLWQDVLSVPFAAVCFDGRVRFVAITNVRKSDIEEAGDSQLSKYNIIRRGDDIVLSARQSRHRK